MTVKQAENVVDLLEYFARRRSPASLAEVADGLGWPRSSTFNLLSTLAAKGYLYEPRGRGGYYPSPRWLATARSLAEAEPLPEAIEELMLEVAEATGETTMIGGAVGAAAIFTHVIESPAAIRYFAAVGNQVPIHASSTGRAILAQWSSAERRVLYRKISFQRYGGTTPVDAEDVEARLAREVERGFHHSDGEYSQDLTGVAVPLTLSGRRLALTVAGPTFRCGDRVEATAALLQKAVARLPRELLSP